MNLVAKPVCFSLAGETQMSRLSITAMLALWAGVAALAQENGAVHFQTRVLPDLADATVYLDRVSCTNGRFDASTKRAAEASEVDPDTVLGLTASGHCPAVLVETAKRGTLHHFYAARAQENGFAGDATGEHQRVLSAALEDATEYENIMGIVLPLNCELAFDAGFYFGVFNPDRPVAVAVSEEQIDQLTRQCFGEQNVPTRNAVIAGIRFGQMTASDLAP